MPSHGSGCLLFPKASSSSIPSDASEMYKARSDRAKAARAKAGLHMGGSIPTAEHFPRMEIATQQIIQNQRAATGPVEDDKDILSVRYDPNALKEHLLKITTDHRAGMVDKRGKLLHRENGNVEIGNGYGVPGGSAYHTRPYSDQSRNVEIGNSYGVPGGGAYHARPSSDQSSLLRNELLDPISQPKLLSMNTNRDQMSSQS